ncbi:MAG: 6-carboxytetrahydropterin synthase [Candidatus Marinimicrobia bacterium]|nr:6-carboxytetrahydropterin synthase [Candidatus Neomarinimicrobiota bacterium]
MIIITKRFQFCAAHRYWNRNWSEERNQSVFGKDTRVHGHNYQLEVSFAGEVDPDTGFIVDLGDVRKIVTDQVVDLLDHTQIEKDLPWFADRQPSSENVVVFIWQQLEPHFAGPARLAKIRLYETPTIYTEYLGGNDDQLTRDDI